jgi:hypothetical protein
MSGDQHIKRADCFPFEWGTLSGGRSLVYKFLFFRQDEPSRRAISKGTFVPNVPNFFLADKYFCSLLDKGMAQNLDSYGVYFCRGWDRSLSCAHLFPIVEPSGTLCLIAKFAASTYAQDKFF